MTDLTFCLHPALEQQHREEQAITTKLAALHHAADLEVGAQHLAICSPGDVLMLSY